MTKVFRHLSEFTAELTELGASPRHIRGILRAWMGVGSWGAPAGEPRPRRLEDELPRIRRALEAAAEPLGCEEEGARSKFLMRLSSGDLVEAVMLPADGLCISSQVGCAVGCVFCMTGRSGLVRQLGSLEILAQVREGLRRNPKLRKIKFMGMGEPSHNRRAVTDAVRFLGETLDWAHKGLTVSTVGDADFIELLETSPVRPALALSLHTLDPEARRTLLPKAPEEDPEKLLLRALTYAEAVRFPLQVEWTLLKGVNDSVGEIGRLARLLEGRPAMVNFIDLNPIPGLAYERLSPESVEDLITVLRRAGVRATRRASAAQSEEGGCGQLRVRVLTEGGYAAG